MAHTLVFTNADSDTVSISEDTAATYKLLSAGGVGAAQALLLTTEAPGQIGNKFLDAEIEPRVITVEAVMAEASFAAAFDARATLVERLNPYLGEGVLAYTFPTGGGDVTRYIDAVVMSGPVFLTGSTNQRAGVQVFSISFYCPHPWWRSTAQSQTTITSAGGAEVCVNGGVLITPVTVVMKATGDATTEASLTNGATSENLTLEAALSMDTDDTVTIRTGFGVKSVSYYDQSAGTTVNALEHLAASSEWMWLAVGNNSMTAAQATGTISIDVTWYNRWPGV